MISSTFAIAGMMFVCAGSRAAEPLQERADTLQEVVVTGTGTRHALKDAPVQTEVISKAMIESYGGSSIEDILAGLTSSFDFSESDMGSGMQLNGLDNNYILILIDGKRLHGDVGGENDLSLIDPHNIEKIEIVRGASSALYGSDAIAGVINIITKSHEGGILAENSTRIGSYGDVRQHNGIGVTIGKVTSYTGFQFQHSDGWQNTSIEDEAQTDVLITDSRNMTVNRHSNWQVSERLTWDVNARLQLYADGSIYWKRIYRPCGKYASTDVKTYDLEYHNGGIAVGGKYKLKGNDYLQLDVDWARHAYYHYFTAITQTDGYYQGEYRNDIPYFPGQKQLQSDQQRTMATLKGVFTLPQANILSAGLEWRYDYLESETRVDGKSVDDNTGAAYIQDEFSLLDPLTITAGLRLTHNESFGEKLTPKISAMLRLDDARIRATWSQGFKTPTTKELYYHYIRYMSGTYLYLGNENLKPQTSNYFSLNAEYTIGPVNISVTGYYNNVKDMINLVVIPTSEAPAEYIVEYQPVKVKQYRNLESAKTWGADVNIRYTGKNITAGAGYSYLDTDATLYDDDAEELVDVTIDGMAHHKGNVFATWSHAFCPSYKLSIGLYGRFSTKRYYQLNGNGKGYNIWRITTGHDIGHSKKMTYRVEAGVDNIFNYCDKTPHGLHLGTTTPGTTIYASVSVKFNSGKKIKTTDTNTHKLNKHNENEED